MGNLLKFEFRKLFRQKSFYICGAIMVCLIVMAGFLLNMLVQLNTGIPNPNDLSDSINSISPLSGIYLMSVSLSQCDASIIFAVFTALFVCSDYTNGTLKNIIARGYSRINIYAAKYAVSIAAVTLLTVVCWITGFLSGTALWGVGSFAAGSSASGFVIALLLQLLAMYAYTSFFFLLSVLFKKNGGSIAVGILAPLIITTIASLIDAFIRSDSIKVSNYWLDTCFANVSAINIPSELAIRCLICFLIYIAVCTLGGHLIGNKSEV